MTIFISVCIFGGKQIFIDNNFYFATYYLLVLDRVIAISISFVYLTSAFILVFSFIVKPFIILKLYSLYILKSLCGLFCHLYLLPFVSLFY